MPTPLITKKKAAELLGVVPSTVQRMIERGELTPAYVGRSGDHVVVYMFAERDVIALAERRAA